MATKPRIAMIGKGNVGRALSEGLKRAGYPVDAVGKEPARVQELARRADVVVLAVPFGERDNALKEMGDAVNGKPLVDVTNALTSNNEFATDVRESGAEQLQKKASKAKVVKAFNMVFADNMSTGRVAGEPITNLVAGNDEAARRIVITMSKDIGFDPVDAGPLANARWLETMGYLNIQLGYGLKMGTGIGFKLVRAQPEARTPMSPAGATRSR